MMIGRPAPLAMVGRPTTPVEGIKAGEMVPAPADETAGEFTCAVDAINVGLMPVAAGGPDHGASIRTTDSDTLVISATLRSRSIAKRGVMTRTSPR
jgi:hypothetical protein